MKKRDIMIFSFSNRNPNGFLEVTVVDYRSIVLMGPPSTSKGHAAKEAVYKIHCFVCK